MNQHPMQVPSAEEQQRVMGQLYALVEKQVQSYQKHRHMGKSTSIPMELAQELMESIEFTTRQVGGVYAHGNAEKTFAMGQGVLERKLEQANALLKLVGEAAPRWQTECRWEALSELKRYLEGYDFRHLAHRGPDTLFYPILIAIPEDFRGIDLCLFYLNVLLAENRIMAAIREEVLENLWDRLPDAALNQCEHVLLNGIGKALLGIEIDTLIFEPDAYPQLVAALAEATEEKLNNAAELLCRWLKLEDADTSRYVKAILPQMRFYCGENALHCDLYRVFV